MRFETRFGTTMQIDRSKSGKHEIVSLVKSADFLLNECRMVLPGIQALFGFQLIAVFNSSFKFLLTQFEQNLHLFGLTLTAISIAFVMTPAALHRQTGSAKVTEEFLQLASRLLLWGMWPLMVAICIDIYLIAQIIINERIALILSAIVLILFVYLWFVLPQLQKHNRH